MIGREQPDQMLRGIRFTLDFDRLMGVRSEELRWLKQMTAPGPTAVSDEPTPFPFVQRSALGFQLGSPILGHSKLSTDS